MDGSLSTEADDVDWNTEDELEIGNLPLSSPTRLTQPRVTAAASHWEARTSAGSSNSLLIKQFVGMGFSEDLVARAIQDNEGNEESILNSLLTYKALERSPEHQNHVDTESCSTGYAPSSMDDLDIDSSENEDISTPSPDKEKLSYLMAMGYTLLEASIAVERCGADSSIEELTDFICAAQVAKASGASLPLEDEKPMHMHKKRKLHDYELCKRKKQMNFLDEDDDSIRLPNPMIGFGILNEPPSKIHRALPEAAIGPPFFYYENVACAPKGVWTTISRFLYEVEPEFVDSKYFCACARKRGYVHNLPIQNRSPLLPLPPRTIHEALPLTRKWWPSWDTRTKLNCIQTSVASAKLTDMIRKALEDWTKDPPLKIQKYVLDQCRKWNLVWVGRNKVAPLECDEVEMLLGFPKNHTRGGGASRTDRYKSLGNSFQVDTVAYHLSVLKDMFPGGINVLSLFSGIGGAEVALHRLGIPLKTVVSVELLEVNRNIMSSWWEQTNQRGNLIHISDIQRVNVDMLEQMMNSFGAFDLVVGGSPCNNLAGNNRYTRDGLEGEQSSLFHDFIRVLDSVKSVMTKDP